MTERTFIASDATLCDAIGFIEEDPDITLSAAERNIGGLGIFMVKKSMDDVAYSRTDGKNIFTMKKAI